METSKILVIEDDAIWRRIIEDTLALENREIWCATTYREARELLTEHTFDLAIVDIRLEDSDPQDIKGMVLLDAIAARRIPAIVLTAYGTPELTRDAFKNFRVFDFITKHHIELGEFRDSVQQAIDQSKARLSDE